MSLSPTPPSTTASLKTILVVEDDECVLKVVATVLAKEGYRVRIACDPLAALQVLQDSTPVDLLLVDVVMPVMDGISLAARATACRPHLSVLFMCGWPGNPRLDQVLLQGLPMLQKPFSPAELTQRIRALMEPLEDRSPSTRSDVHARGGLRADHD